MRSWDSNILPPKKEVKKAEKIERKAQSTYEQIISAPSVRDGLLKLRKDVVLQVADVVQDILMQRPGRIVLPLSAAEISMDEMLFLSSFFGRFGYAISYHVVDGETKVVAVDRLQITPEKIKLPAHIALNPIYRSIYNAIHALNRNFVQVNLGPTGSGKSWAGLRFAFDIDPEFDVSKVIFEPKELLDYVMQSARVIGGTAVLWDEVGVAINVRRWYTLKNLITSYIIQTFRFKNIFLVQTVPSLTYIDSQVQRLLHGALVLLPRTEYNVGASGVFYHIRFNPRTGKMYFIRPRFNYKGHRFVIANISIPAPPTNITREYEKKREKYMDQFYRLLRQMAEVVEESEKEGAMPRIYKLIRVINEVIENIDRYIDKKGWLMTAKIRTDFKLSDVDWKFVVQRVTEELAAQGKLMRIGRAWRYIEGEEDLDEMEVE